MPEKIAWARALDRTDQRRRFGAAAAPLLICCLALPAGASGEGLELTAGSATPCPQPVLVLRTARGAIEVELVESAAPEAIRWVVRLARGPLYHPELVAEISAEEEIDAGEVGFYDGLTFDYTRPHIEIAVETRVPEGLFRTDTRIDAHALGLDRDTVTDTAEAMSVLQGELLPEVVRNKKRGHITAELRAWAERWRESQSTEFLVGTSRQEIAEALGYVYQTDLDSLPPKRGAVALWPVSPLTSSARLTIFLTDLPERAGRWMVIGRVVRGLEVAETISARPLTPGPKYRLYRPAEPVAIENVDVECRESHPSEHEPEQNPKESPR